MSKEIGQERRATERFRLKANITYEPSAGLDLKEGTRVGETVNVSKGGFCIKTEVPLTQCQIIRARIPIPDVYAASPTLAEVCWIEELREERGYWIGLRFLI